MRRTHMVSTGLALSVVSSCRQSSGPAKPYLATIATPLRSLVLDFHPSSLRTFSGDPQTPAHDFGKAERDDFRVAADAAGEVLLHEADAPPVQRLRVSVQLAVSANRTRCPGMPGSPLPDWMLNHATLKDAGAPCAKAAAGAVSGNDRSERDARAREHTCADMRPASIARSARVGSRDARN